MRSRPLDAEPSIKLKIFLEVKRYFYNYIYVIKVTLLCCCSNSILLGQTSDEIFKNYLKNYGGTEGIKKIKSLILLGKGYSSITNKSYKIVYYKSRPSLFRNEHIENNDTTYYCYDGNKNCLGSKPERPTIGVLSKLLEKNKEIIKESMFSAYVELGSSANLSRILNIEGYKMYELVYSDTNTEKYFYIDTLNYLLLKEVNIDTKNHSHTIIKYNNFKEFNGIYFPLSIVYEYFKDNVSNGFIKCEYEDIKINNHLDISLFKCP